jgi:hypothetical protein
MECMICYSGEAKYKIQCGANVPHCVCFTCEKTLRLKSKPTSNGRMLTCPYCRKEEKEAGLRSRSSYEAELKVLYEKLYPKPIAHYQRLRDPEVYIPRDGWCKNRALGCQKRTRTTRTCSYPSGCTEYVCRNCTMCVGHFSQVPTNPMAPATGAAQEAILAE